MTAERKFWVVKQGRVLDRCTSIEAARIRAAELGGDVFEVARRS